MRIHELLEACVEYVAMDGVLGSDPHTLIQHLKSLDKTIDDEFFRHIYRLLVAHGSIQVILTKHPLPSPDGHLLLGTAPLPIDFDAAEVAGEQIGSAEGLRGRALAFHKEGKEYQTDKETIAANREAKRLKAKEQKKTASAKARKAAQEEMTDEQEGDALMRFVGANDGGEGAQKVPRDDLAGLLAKWGSRLRIRATDEEIYYRLTGSHQKIGKLSPTVFHTLQLAARTREKGISAIELGPAVGTSQGSMHYFMKVLCQLGLCGKVPVVTHSSVTNLLIFHKYLDQNAHYRASMRLPPLTNMDAAPAVRGDPATDFAFTAQADDEDLDDDDDDAVSQVDPGWSLSFGPLTEEELMVGHLVKERLIKLLDHPSLRNHLLKRKNLLQLLGWQGAHVLRHRRAVARHIDTLQHAGVIEVIEVGEKRIRCLRLTKYNPDYVPRTENTKIEEVDEDGLHTIDDSTLVAVHSGSYSHSSSVSATLPIEYQINDAVVQSGVHGMIIAELRCKLDYFFKRNIEFHFVRSEHAYVPPQLRTHKIVQTMDSLGRERRLRAYSLIYYRQWAESVGHPIDEAIHPPLTDEIGRWASLTLRGLYNDPSEVDNLLEHFGAGTEESIIKGKKSNMKRKAQIEQGDDAEPSENEKPLPKKARKYDNTVQIRGRPRKYIHVVDEEGKVQRNVIGSVFPHPDLEPIYIWIKETNSLVPAPKGYPGTGPPPKLGKEDTSRSRTPQSFAQYDKNSDSKKVKGSSRKSKNTTQVKKISGAKGTEQNELGESDLEEGSVKPVETPAEGNTSGPPSVDPPGEMSGLGDAGHNNGALQLKKPKGRPRKSVKPAEMAPVAVKNSTTGKKDEQDGTMHVSSVDSIHGADQVEHSLHHAVPAIAEPSALPGPSAPSLTDHHSLSMTATSLAASTLASSGSSQAPKTLSPKSPATTPLLTTASSSVKRMGRKPKYTPQELSIPTLTPGTLHPPSTPSSTLADPIIAEDWDSSVLLPKNKKNHPVFDQLAPSTPGLPTPTPSPLKGDPMPSVSPILAPSTMLDEAESGLFSTRKGKKRKGSPRPDYSSASSLATTTPQTGKRARQRGETPSAGSPSAAKAGTEFSRENSSQHAQEDDAIEVPVEWLALRSRIRQQEADKKSESQAEKASMRIAQNTEAKEADVTLDAQVPEDEARYIPDSTPLLELRPDTHVELKSKNLPIRSHGSRASKVDIGHVRRSNELLQTLRESGEILELNQFRKELWEWHKRVAGTSHPFAPPIATQMDRSVFIRALATLLDEGKLKMTNATVPTITGGIRQAKVYWLPETKKETVTNYIRGLGQAMTLVYGPKSRASAQIPATEFTEIRPAGPQGWNNRKKLDPNANVTSMTALAGTIEPAERRAILEADVTVVPILYGYHSGRNARIATMHTAIVNVLDKDFTASGVFSTSPRVFGLEMLFNDIPASAWFKSVSWPRYQEELLEFVGSPATKDKPLRDIPVGTRPKQGFGGHYSKQKIVALLSNMAMLKLIEPLVIVDEADADADLVVEQANGTRVGFRSAKSVAEAMFFRLYESAPVYHIATGTAGLVGLLPVQTAKQAEDFWKVIKEAAVNDDINALPTMERRVDPTRHAPLTDTLEFPSAEIPKLFQARARWRTEIRPVEVQRAAIDSIIDHRAISVRLKSDEELEKFAWGWCLTLDILKEQIHTRLEKLMSKSDERRILQRHQADNQKAAERRKKASSELAAKIAEIRATSKLEWEKRIEAAAERTGAEVTKELDEYLTKYTLTMSRFSVSTRDTDALSDEALDEGCRMYRRSKAVGFLALPEQLGPTARKAPIPRRPRKDRKTRAPKPRRVPGQPAKRNRRQWTDEDEDTLLECEAIIRARFKGKATNKPGRQALHQIFDDASQQVYLNRLRKYLSRPGKQIYFERLIDIYHELWLTHRGTQELPEPNPDSPHDFDLKRHLMFFRENVPRGDIWASVLENYVGNELKTEDLQDDVGILIKDKDWDYKAIPQPSITAVWNPIGGDDLRLNSLNSSSMIAEPNEAMYDVDKPEKGKVKSLVKMIVKHPVGDYHVDVGTRLSQPLQSFQESSIQELINDKIIRRTKAASDGRVYQHPVAWLQACEGPFGEDLMAEAAGLGHRLDQAAQAAEWLEWPLIGKSGEMAALLDMVSNDEVDFDFNCNEFPTTQYWRDTYNTRKLNDVDLEFDLSIKRKRTLGEQPEIDPPSVLRHNIPQKWEVEEVRDEYLVNQAMNAIKAEESHGITKPELQARLGVDTLTLIRLFETLSKKEIFWAGYDTARIVHTSYWQAWALATRPPIRDPDGRILGVSTDDTKEVLVAPRRWTTVWGERVESTWEAAKRNVIGWIVSRPGCTERTLRNQVGKTLDRLEFNEVLQYLLDTGVVRRASAWEGMEIVPPVEATDQEEEVGIVVFPEAEALWR